MNGLIISPLSQQSRADPALLEILASAFRRIPGIVGALLLGSRSRGNSHPKNADVLLVVDHMDLVLVELIVDAKMRVQHGLGFGISINVHTVADTDPTLFQHGHFMHKNRAELFIYQAKYTSVVLFGRNVFDAFCDPSPTALRSETIRVVASFGYFLRKFLFDQSMAPHGTAEFIRTPLIALEYLAAFHGYISMGYQDGLDHLVRCEKVDCVDLDLLRECSERKSTSRYADVGQVLMLEACEFLDRMHATLVKTYRCRGVSDIRWNGSTCDAHWNLDLPQAASMVVLRQQDKILLLRRPSDDYLYPSRWTTPGGYLQHAENPSQAAARELLEETGLHLAPDELFKGRPVISSRWLHSPLKPNFPTDPRPHASSSMTPVHSSISIQPWKWS
jgi:hypothetical protein